MNLELPDLSTLDDDVVTACIEYLQQLIAEAMPGVDVTCGAAHRLVLGMHAIIMASTAQAVAKVCHSINLLELVDQPELGSDVIVDKLAEQYNIRRRCVGGVVETNRELTQRMQLACVTRGACGRKNIEALIFNADPDDFTGEMHDVVTRFADIRAISIIGAGDSEMCRDDVGAVDVYARVVDHIDDGHVVLDGLRRFLQLPEIAPLGMNIDVKPPIAMKVDVNVKVFGGNVGREPEIADTIIDAIHTPAFRSELHTDMIRARLLPLFSVQPDKIELTVTGVIHWGTVVSDDVKAHDGILSAPRRIGASKRTIAMYANEIVIQQV